MKKFIQFLSEKKMTEKKAKAAFRMAHINLTPKQVKIAHKGEKYLEKHKIEGKRVKGGVKFSKKGKK